MVEHSVLVGEPRALDRFVRQLRRFGAIFTIGTVIVGGALTTTIVVRHAIVAPPSGGQIVCTKENAALWDGVGDTGLGGANCITNATITMTNDDYFCTQPISTIAAAAGGSPPLKIVINMTQYVPALEGGAGFVNFDNGCVGDGTSAIDVVVEINGVDGIQGVNGGPGDAVKTRQTPGPLNLDITGNFDCGAPPPAGHPDIIQFQHQNTDRNISFVNGKSGDYDAGHATCQGAGGIIYTSGFGIDIIGGKYIACNHTMISDGTPSDNTIRDASFRNGRVEAVVTGGETNCAGYNSPNPPCHLIAHFAVFTGNTCQKWNATTNTWDTAAPD